MLRPAKWWTRPDVAAFVFSALFHLSMITVFSIVVRFPVEQIKYYEARIVPDRSYAPVPTPSIASSIAPQGPRLQAPSIENAQPWTPAPDIAAPESEPWAAGLSPPRVMLPTLFESDLARLTLRSQVSLSAEAPEEDAWSRLGHDLERLGDAISRLAGKGSSSREDAQAAPLTTIPAPGFEVVVDWLTEPKERQFLFSPPIKALGDTDPASLTSPLMFILRVSADGRVREVLQGSVSSDEALFKGVSVALMRYRFEPLPDDQAADQRASLIIRPGKSTDDRD